MKEKECLQAFLFFCSKLWEDYYALMASALPHHIFQNAQRTYIAETFNMHGIIL